MPVGYKSTKELFIKQSKLIHGNKYDYSKVEYINNKTKVNIVCIIHGTFEQRPGDHLKGSGCKKCSIVSRNNKLSCTAHSFIEKAKIIHGNKYDYSKVEYVNNETKIKIICPIHGEFIQRPGNHLQGMECIKCGIKKTVEKRSKTTDKFIEESKKIHGDRYDYSKVKYVNSKKKVYIICKVHGEFEQIAGSHLSGYGCKKCADIQDGLNKRLSNKEFVCRAKKIHKNKYSYHKTKYTTMGSKVVVTCSIHGDFFPVAGNYLRGSGCPVCNESKGEIKICNFLKLYNIKHIREYRFKDPIVKVYEYDFFLIDYDLIIEFNGEQHYKPIDPWGGIIELRNIKKRDKIKKKYCLDNNINFLEIPYTKIDQIEYLIRKKIKECVLKRAKQKAAQCSLFQNMTIACTVEN
jgi:hypothetical protein